MISKMVLIDLAGRGFSLPVEKIRHILPGPDIFPLVGLRQGVAGVFLYEREPVPMLDPANLADLSPEGVSSGEYAIVVQSEYGNVGLPVDSAVRIVDREDGLIEDAEPEGETTPTGSIFCYQNASYPILDIDAVLARLPY